MLKHLFILQCILMGNHRAGSFFLVRDKWHGMTRLRCIECMAWVGKPFHMTLPSDPKFALSSEWKNGTRLVEPKIVKDKAVRELEALVCLDTEEAPSRTTQQGIQI